VPGTLVAVAVSLIVGSPAHAADPRFADWPCVQIKVPEISVAAVWAGPSIDDVGDAWQRDPALRDLVARLAVRRTPLDEAQRSISEFLVGSAQERREKAKLVFAGLFARLNAERSQVMNGIERLYRQQKTFADQIRAEVAELRRRQDIPDHAPGKLQELTDKVGWDTRIFEERRKTISYACEVPVLIEQRLFALARTIEQSM
jgi:hypothetical protein